MNRKAKIRKLIGIIDFMGFRFTEEEIRKIANVIQEALNRLEKMEELKDGDK
ncbi:MAG: hypothetical protein ACRC30_10950 [Clostridium sp.]